MAILYNLPFKFHLEVCGREDTIENVYGEDVRFFDSIEDLASVNYRPDIKVREGRDVFVRLACDMEFRLEMDGLDAVNEPYLQHDVISFIDKPNELLRVFKHNLFPLPPGYYVIKIMCNSRSYYTGFAITSSRLSDEYWYQMANEVKDEIQGMAFQWVYQRLGLHSNGMSDQLISSLYLRMEALDRLYVPVLAAINDLRFNPHNKISRNYVLTTKLDGYPADFKANKLNRRNIYGEKRYMPVKFTDYNLPENRYVKKVTLNLEKLVLSFMEETRDKLDVARNSQKIKTGYLADNRYENVVNCLKDFSDKARKLHHAISLLKNEEWFKQLPDSVSIIPSQSVLDPRYAILDKINKELRAQKVSFEVDNRLSMIWKNSSTLYELWGMIKVVNALQTLGFELVDGPWIERVRTSHRLGGLQSSDVLRFESEDVFINVSYDKDLPASDIETDKIRDPIYTVGNNRTPDCRIDFYLKGKGGNIAYLGTLVIDFKYRSYLAIFGDSDSYPTRRQLVSYGSMTRSKYLLNYPEKYSNNVFHPVYEVWAVYPDLRDETVDLFQMSYNIRFVSLTPKNNNLADKLAQFMDDYIGVHISTLG